MKVLLFPIVIASMLIVFTSNTKNQRELCLKPATSRDLDIRILLNRAHSLNGRTIYLNVPWGN